MGGLLVTAVGKDTPCWKEWLSRCLIESWLLLLLLLLLYLVVVLLLLLLL